MEASGVDADDSYRNARDVVGKLPPSRDTPDARLVSSDYFEMVESRSARSTKPYACVDCRYATDRKNNLRRHRATMHERCERALECCGLTFVSKSELREHVTENHGAGAGYACAQCGRRFGRRALMRRHAAVHDGRLATDGGGRRRSTTSGVSIGRRYACSECEYTTGHKSNLDRHFRRHAAGPPAETQSTFTGDIRYPPSKTTSTEDSEPDVLSAIIHRDLGIPRNGCCCHICLYASYYRQHLPPSSPSTSMSSQAPFTFSFVPPRLDDPVWGFRESYLPDVDVRRPWSLYAGDRGPSTEDADNLWSDLSASKDSAGQVEVENVPGHHDEADGRPSSSKNSAGDKDADSESSDVTGTCYRQLRRTLPRLHGCINDGQLRVVDGLYSDEPGGQTTSTPCAGDDGGATEAASDVTGTCYRRRRLRLLPMLHTCRSCSLTFVSQLQLKFHCDLFHRAADLDAAARPICCRVNKPDFPPPVL